MKVHYRYVDQKYVKVNGDNSSAPKYKGNVSRDTYFILRVRQIYQNFLQKSALKVCRLLAAFERK
jgi:hypothetical protein